MYNSNDTPTSFAIIIECQSGTSTLKGKPMTKRSALTTLQRKAVQLSSEEGIAYDVHHRHPRSRKDSYSRHINHPSNLTILETEIHRAWHRIIGNRLPDEVAALLTEKFISPDYYLVAVPRNKKSGHRRRRVYCTDCECEVLTKIPKKEKS